MTERNKTNLQIAVTLLAGGIVWGTLTAQVGNKLDKETFRSDSVEVRSELRAILRRIDDQNDLLRETNQRLRELACRGQGPECR